MKAAPNALNVALTRLASTGRAATIAKLVIGEDSFVTTLTANATGAVGASFTTFIKVIFKDNPSIFFGSHWNQWVSRKVDMIASSLRTAVHAYLCRQVFHLALHG
jgi:hypothetical protein